MPASEDKPAAEPMAATALSEVAGHPNLRAFPKGVSGNPGGRSRLELGIARMARERAPEVVGYLLEIAGNRKAPAMARVAASGLLLDRGFGKAPQRVEVQGADFASMSNAALDAFIAARLAEMRAIEGETAEAGDDVPPDADRAGERGREPEGR